VSNSSEIPQIDPGLRARAARDFALYGAARLGLAAKRSSKVTDLLVSKCSCNAAHSLVAVTSNDMRI